MTNLLDYKGWGTALQAATNKSCSNGMTQAKQKLDYNFSMVDPTPSQPTPERESPEQSPTKSATQPVDALTTGAPTDFHIGEEFGTAKRTLPPARIVMICMIAIAVIVGIFAFKERAKPQGAGAINFVSSVDVPNQNIILAAITFALRNTADKPLWVHTLKAHLVTADGKTYDDEAASVVDLDRYYQAFPPLKESSEPPLSPETKMLAGTEKKGTIIVSFPISKEVFDQRKSLSVRIQPYDQPLPIILE
jgi:hypothetical protein